MSVPWEAPFDIVPALAGHWHVRDAKQRVCATCGSKEAALATARALAAAISPELMATNAMVEVRAQQMFEPHKTSVTWWANLHPDTREEYRCKARAELAALPLMAGLAGFAVWALDQAREGCDPDGGDFQDKAEALGLIVATKVDKPCEENCPCAEFADDEPFECYRDAPELHALAEALGLRVDPEDVG